MKATMRIVLMATACMMLLASAPAMAQDCTAIRRACVAHCLGGQGSTGDLNPVTTFLPERVKACVGRCSIAPCQQTPLSARLCDASAQALCSRSFRSCTDACTFSTAATQAIIQTQASCATFCCTNFKQCLSNRQCDISTIAVITCEENISGQ